MTEVEQRLRLAVPPKSKTNNSLKQKFNSGREKRERLAFIEKVRKAKEFSDWWKTLDKDTDYIREHDDASNGHS